MAVKKILVVDDNATDLKNMEQIVAGAGCSVVSATGGTEALAKAKSEKPDLIFLDIQLFKFLTVNGNPLDNVN